MIKSFFKYYSLTITLLLFSNTVNATEIVRAVITSNNTQIVDIALFDNDTPITVTNFINNIDTNIYENLFFNRSVNNFVIQTGGYTYTPTLNDGTFSYAGNDQFNGGLQPTPNVITIQNEFKLSNLRGTLAMAKPSNSVDSSSNEWFINLSDNTFLDTSSEGFTVFGEILGSGMEAIDQIAATTTYNLSTDIDFKAAFTDVPLNNVTDETNTIDINNNNLIKIKLTRLFSITDILDFGDANPGSPVQKSIVVGNTSGTSLSIAAFDTGTIAPPFNILNDGCSLQTLLAAELCSILIEFSPTVSTFYEGIGNITIQTYNHTIPVILKTPTPDISLTKDFIDFGFQPVYDSSQGLPEQAVLRINNTGDRDLSLSSIIFSSPTLDEFEFIDNCTTDNNDYLPGKIQPDSFCILVINFKPKDIFAKTAIVSIISNDPDEPEVNINVTANNSDNDGIDNAIEDAAPNNGDGNFDGGPDRLQDNVVSFRSANGVYTTLISDENTLFTNVQPVQLTTLETLPGGITLKNEALAFELSGFIPRSVVELGLILPADITLTNLYSYGPTPENNTPHWYTLEKNATPGITLFGNVSYGNVGDKRNISIIRILDGGIGDADLQANGKIVFVGGPEISNKGSSGSGALLWMLLLIPISILLYRKF